MKRRRPWDPRAARKVDRVNTPLMMIYGDFDHVAMQQGEEFFTVLNRQGKRAQLVRYWGNAPSRRR